MRIVVSFDKRRRGWVWEAFYGPSNSDPAARSSRAYPSASNCRRAWRAFYANVADATECEVVTVR